MKPNEGSTVIGKSVVVRGELSGNEDLYMDGQLEGTITLTDSLLTIGPNARVVANLKVRDLIIFGRLIGNVQASGRIELRDSASVNGDLIASRLSVEDSAFIQGRVELSPPTATKTPVASPAASSSSQTPPKAFVLEPRA